MNIYMFIHKYEKIHVYIDVCIQITTHMNIYDTQLENKKLIRNDKSIELERT
jgi:hypothetical protein